jgi:pimeloyl-ACP methyl ester carboxylesterase
LFVHATGFHGRVWDQVIAEIHKLQPDRRCIAFDARGHGRSSVPEPPDPYAWRFFADDVIALCAALELTGVVGVGHSMGGHSLAWAAAQQPDLFSKLLLIDPVIFPRQFYGLSMPGEHPTARRRSEWESPDAMFEKFVTREPFLRWKPEILRDYVQYGLHPKVGGGYELACPPRVESIIYPLGTHADIYDELAKVAIPVDIVRAKYNSNVLPATDFSYSPTEPDLVKHFPNATDTYLEQYTHFIPMEAPELVAKMVTEL